MVFRYPDEKTPYLKRGGITRVGNIAAILAGEGLRPIFYRVEKKGADINVFDINRLCLVVEVTNWSKTSYMDLDRINSINDNLSIYHCSKLLICSFEDNYHRVKDAISDKIDIINIGFQTNPFYYWLLEHERNVEDKRPDTYETFLLERNKILPYLDTLNLLRDNLTVSDNTITTMYTTGIRREN